MRENLKGTYACKLCDAMKPATREHFSKNWGPYLMNYCKPCDANRLREFKAKNPTYLSEWWASNPDANARYSKRYNATHVEQRTAERKAAAPVLSKLAAARYLADPKKFKDAIAAYRAANPDKVRQFGATSRARRARAPGKFSSDDIRAQYESQQGTCHWCKQTLAAWHIDHVIPLSKGGTHWPDNIVIACPICNLRKAAKMPDVFLESLKR